MNTHRWTFACACLVVAAMSALPAWAQADAQQTPDARGGAAGAGGGAGGGRRGRGGGGGGRGAVDPAAAAAAAVAPADLKPILRPADSEMALVVTRYDLDRGLVNRYYDVVQAPMHIARLKRFDADWLDALGKIDESKLTPAAKNDLGQLKSTIQNNVKQLDEEAVLEAQIAPLLPFAPGIVKLEEARRRMDSMDAEKAAVQLEAVNNQIKAMQAKLMEALGDERKFAALNLTRSQVQRAADAVDAQQRSLRGNIREWFGFYNDYDPMFTWWMAQPYKEFNQVAGDYAAFLRDKVAPAAKDGDPAPVTASIAAADPPKFAEVPNLQELLTYPQNELRDIDQRFSTGRRAARNPQYFKDWLTALNTLDFDKLSRNAQVDYLHIRNSCETQIARLTTPPAPPTPRKPDNNFIPGTPVGRQTMMFDLQEEMIPYTPEELFAIAETEYAWCEKEAKSAARELGLGDDWKKAMEMAKQHHVPPGKQPDMIRDLMFEAVDYLRTNDMITVSEVDAETLRMEMMSLQRQQVNPFFTGGTLISVSYPVMEMTTEQKLESMRGNNWDFSRSTVHHELIPGHNMQGFMNQRFRGARGGEMGSTPFYGEGWAVYWEMMFYQKGYAHTPLERIGFMYWRMHRCARIVFSLKFHLGEMSPNECVDYLIDKVGHERENAIGEVRRSFGGGYSTLYQAGYLLGAIQFREIRKELVDTGQLTEKQYHDYVLQRETSMPVQLIRLGLGKEKLSPDMPLNWKFYGPNPGK